MRNCQYLYVLNCLASERVRTQYSRAKEAAFETQPLQSIPL